MRIFLFFQGKSNDILSGGVKEIILISVTFILGGLWLISADHELSILENHLGKWLPRYKFSPRVISYSIPSFIIILSATTNYIHIYSFAYFLYIIIDVFGRKVATDFVRKAIDGARNYYERSNEAIDKIYAYYILNPFGLRGCVTGSVFFIISIVGLYIENSTDKFIILYKATITMILYIISIGNIVLSEVVIWFWRSKLYSFISNYDDNERIKSINNSKRKTKLIIYLYLLHLIYS